MARNSELQYTTHIRTHHANEYFFTKAIEIVRKQTVSNRLAEVVLEKTEAIRSQAIGNQRANFWESKTLILICGIFDPDSGI